MEEQDEYITVGNIKIKKSFSLDSVLNDKDLKQRLAELSAWEEYSQKTVPIIWDRMQENVARQRRERHGY